MLKDFEVLVSTVNGRSYYSQRLKRYVIATTKKWIHIENVRSHDQAAALAKKPGRRVIAVRKFDPTRSVTNIEKLETEPMTAIEMDELIMMKQRKKIDNRWKDKAKVFGDLDKE